MILTLINWIRYGGNSPDKQQAAFWSECDKHSYELDLKLEVLNNLNLRQVKHLIEKYKHSNIHEVTISCDGYRVECSIDQDGFHVHSIK